MTVTPFRIARKRDGSPLITSGAEVNLFDYRFTEFTNTTMPGDITTSLGTAATAGIDMGTGAAANIPFLKLITGTTAGQSSTVAWKALDTSVFSYMWMRAILRSPDSGKADNTLFGLYGNASEGGAWYQSSGDFLAYNSGDTPLKADRLYPTSAYPRWAYREVGLLLIPGSKVVAATDGKNIINAGSWSTFVSGTIYPRIACRSTVAGAMRTDVLRWRLTVGLK